MITDRLYYQDGYLREFRAQVVDLADDGRRVYLGNAVRHGWREQHYVAELDASAVEHRRQSIARVGHVSHQFAMFRFWCGLHEQFRSR